VALSARDLVEVARDLIEGRADLDHAARVLRWAAELEPCEETLLLLASVLTKTGAHEEARKVLEPLPDAEDPEQMNVRAIALAGCLDTSRAITTLTEALLCQPDDYRLWANRGLVRFYACDYDEAANDLVRALVVQDHDWFADLRFSGGEPGLLDFDVVLKGFERIRTEAGPQHAVAFALIDAWARIVESEPKRATKLLDKLPAAAKRTWPVLALRAVIANVEARKLPHEKRGRLEREHEKLRVEAWKAKPDDLALLVSMKHLRWRDDTHAVAELDAILRQASRWLSGWVQVARGKYWIRDFDGAVACAERALEIEPASWEALETLADALVKKGEYERALRALDAIVEAYGIIGAPEVEEEQDDVVSFGGNDDEEEEEDDEEPLGREDDMDELDVEEALRADNQVLTSRAYVKYKMRDLDGARSDYDLAVENAGEEDWGPALERAKFHAWRRCWSDALADLRVVALRMERISGSKEDPGVPWFHRIRAHVRERAGDADGARKDRKLIEKLIRQGREFKVRPWRKKPKKRKR
jgi:tetratricopeptide (TPR) repeat protein